MYENKKLGHTGKVYEMRPKCQGAPACARIHGAPLAVVETGRPVPLLFKEWLGLGK